MFVILDLEYYILFLDCDDSLENSALNKLTKIINKNKYDLISYDYKLYDFRGMYFPLHGCNRIN